MNKDGYWQLRLPFEENGRSAQSLNNDGKQGQLLDNAIGLSSASYRHWPFAWLDTFLTAATNIEMFHGGTLEGVNLKRKGAGWYAIVTITYQGRPMVGFVESDTLADLMPLVGEALRGRRVKWKVDVYRNKRSN
jgi:hypothetical protein